METMSRSLTRLGIAALLTVLPACGGGGYGDGGGTPVPVVTVVFTYDAPTAPDPDAETANPTCFSGTMATHIHPSWRAWAAVFMVANGADQWTLTFSDVPVGTLVSFRLNDPNNCDVSPTGATLTNIKANGVVLSNVVSTPGSGPEPGLSFTVDVYGLVTP
jgi:hypothetical protein